MENFFLDASRMHNMKDVRCRGEPYAARIFDAPETSKPLQHSQGRPGQFEVDEVSRRRVPVKVDRFREPIGGDEYGRVVAVAAIERLDGLIGLGCRVVHEPVVVEFR